MLGGGNPAQHAHYKGGLICMEVKMLQSVMTEPGVIEFRQIERPEIGAEEILMQTKRIGKK